MDSPLVHTLLTWIGSLVGSASVPAIAFGIAWKYRVKLMAWLEGQVAGRVDRVLANTQLGKQVDHLHAQLTTPTPTLTPPTGAGSGKPT